MAHFRAVIKGQRGEASRLGSKGSGIRASVDGWDSGVDVEAVVEKDNIAGEVDVFYIYATSGSHKSTLRQYIGIVTNGEFIPVSTWTQRRNNA